MEVHSKFSLLYILSLWSIRFVYLSTWTWFSVLLVLQAWTNIILSNLPIMNFPVLSYCFSFWQYRQLCTFVTGPWYRWIECVFEQISSWTGPSTWSSCWKVCNEVWFILEATLNSAGFSIHLHLPYLTIDVALVIQFYITFSSGTAGSLGLDLLTQTINILFPLRLSILCHLPLFQFPFPLVIRYVTA